MGGLIPAHAGKTHCKDSCPWCVAAHPRSRGENPTITWIAQLITGSSPLTRGKPILAAGLARCVGLIPAHAGKTGTLCGSAARGTAHPRSRGENPVNIRPGDVVEGSSPLTRGKPGRRTCAPRRPRLIPAHAGKTGLTAAIRAFPEAHPRSRGENFPSFWPVSLADGLIPAHAGKTLLTTWESSKQTAHPRSRGENMQVAEERRAPHGSSPLTRGKLVLIGLDDL